MRKFLYKTLAFYCIAAVLVYVVDYLRIHEIIGYSIWGGEVHLSVKKSNARKEVKTIVLGDSCGRQLYDNSIYNDSIYSLACNRHAMMAGHYFLLHSFIAKNPHLPEDVVLICTPFSLNADVISNGFTFQYFLKPFYHEEYKSLMNEHLRQSVETIPMYWMCKLPYFRCSNFIPWWMAKQEVGNQLISQLSNDYLDSILQLCNKYDISFRLVSAPVRENQCQKLEELLAGEYPMKDTPLIKDYISTIQVLPDSMFVDEVHLKSEKVAEVKERMSFL